MFKPHHIAISAKNLQVTIEFYQKLNFEEKYRWESEDQSLKIVHMKLNSMFLEIFNYSIYVTPRNLKDSLQNDLQKIGLKHFALKVNSLKKAKKYILSQNLAEKVELKKGRTGIDYFFIKDPNDVFIEILEDKRGL